MKTRIFLNAVWWTICATAVVAVGAFVLIYGARLAHSL